MLSRTWSCRCIWGSAEPVWVNLSLVPTNFMVQEGFYGEIDDD